MKESVAFTKTQTRLLNELKAKHEELWRADLNVTLDMIYEEHGLSEKAKDRKLRFMLQPNFAGVDIVSTEPAPAIPQEKPGRPRGRKAKDAPAEAPKE